MTIESELQTIIDNLQHALQVVRKVDYSVDQSDASNVEYTAPYAIGYAKSALQTSIQDLEFVMKTHSISLTS
jgi:hypothetical protein